MLLFNMSDAQLDAAVQAHYDRMYDDYYHVNDPEPCCDNCDFYSDGICQKLENALTEEEAAEMDETEDYSAIEKDKDDYCDKWEPKQQDEWDGDD